MTRRDATVTAIGGLAVLLALGGWAVVEANTGPFEHELEPAEHATQLEGTYVVRDGSASSPLCDSPGTGEACDPETDLDVAVAGLPALGEQAVYAAFLTDGERTIPLGPLEARDGTHNLDVTGEVDGDAYGTLMLALADAGDTATPAFELHTWTLPTSGGETVRLEASSQVQLAPLEGRVSLAQIGAVEVAVTADARLEGLPEADVWRYEAWLANDEKGAWTALGELEPDGDAHLLDARMERVRLVDQDRFLVTLEPPAAPGDEPAGFPVAETAVEAEALLG